MKKVKTKILVTLGPATDSAEKLSELIDAGVNAFRLNFSHGNEEYFDKLFKTINDVCEEKNVFIPIIQDLQGPKIRIGDLAQDEIEIFAGNKIMITTENILGTKDKISTSYKLLVNDASVGDAILIDDGLLKLEIVEKKNEALVCKIINGGILKPRKGMNLPGMRLSTPALTEKDIENLEFALKYNVNYIALSFVRHPEDIKELKKWLEQHNSIRPVIAKIEKPEAVDNFEGILKETDAIMVARGDLGVELPAQLVPIIQKDIIRRCNAVGKTVITATQMLESMIHNPVPTRAEASDVANAVLDGTDVVMLSGETSVGKYPVKAVQIMNEILQTTEVNTQYAHKINYEVPNNLMDNIFDSTGKAFAQIADQVAASLIVVFTHYGRKAKVVAKYRPNAPVIAFSDKPEIVTELNFRRGISAYYLSDFTNEETAVEKAMKFLKENSFVHKKELVIFTAGEPVDEFSRKAWIRSIYVNE